jgi:hypothetical protein
LWEEKSEMGREHFVAVNIHEVLEGMLRTKSDGEPFV